ncbi:MAG: glucosamine-6-phosphate deaminase [bacterium]|nr:glucosamine-6-phosphate deaminase [bacterium]
MQVHVFENAAQVGQAAATLIAAQVLSKPDSVLGLATGSTPIPTYQELSRLCKAGVVDFSRVRSFNLDEYCNLPVDHEQSYHSFMKENLFDHINIDINNTRVPDGNAADPAKEAADYDAAIANAGGIDVQILGIGRNGHIGFNEPGDAFVYGCHIVNLTQSTIEANRRFFESEADVPRQAISLGVGSIINARKILLLATGADKAQAIRDSIYGDINPQTQASILRTHSDVIFLLDKAAASLL